MFLGAKTEIEDQRNLDTPPDLRIPVRPMRPAAEPTPSPGPNPAAGHYSRSSADMAPAAQPPRTSTEARPRAGEAGTRTIIVGREIRLSGNIAACGELLVEGSVEANLTDCQKLELASDGVFKGSAAICEAEIRGRFEGNLVVCKRLLIRATGRVSGTIRYGQIEIERGGQISGDGQAQSESEISPHPGIAFAAE